MNILLFLLIAVFWAGSFIAIKELVNTVPPIMAASMRVAVAIVLLAFLLVLAKKKLGVPRPLLLKVWTTGLFMFGIPFTLLFWGEKQISPGLAAILNGSVPMWTFVFSLVFLKNEKTSLSKFLGLLLGVSGLIFIFYPKIVIQGNRNELLGTLSVAMMAMSYAIGAILARRTLSGANKVDLHAGLFQQLLAGFVFLLILSLGVEDWTAWTTHFSSPASLAAVLYLGWISTALAFIFFYYLLDQWGAVRTTAVAYLVPMIAILLDFVINRRLPTAYELVGTLSIFTGVILIQFDSFKSRQVSSG